MELFLFNGSPRKNGACSFLSEQLVSKYKDSYNISYIKLNELSYSGCQGCYACKDNGSFCVQNDELSQILPKLPEAKLIILLSPNYYRFLTGQVKLFLDRWFCLSDKKFVSKFTKGTKLFFILTQGEGNANYAKPVVDWVKSFTQNYNIKFYSFVLPNCSRFNFDNARLKLNDLFVSLKMFV